VVEWDIRKCLDTIDHDILLNIISKKITYRTTLMLISSALKAGYLDNIGGKIVANSQGTPQGSVLSPLLCNIYLHEMDKKVESMAADFNSGINRRTNPAFKKISKSLPKLDSGVFFAPPALI
jgi:RNA-directed DNA polymerase